MTITKGEFFSLLGPSGSGKTTVLRMIAGFVGSSNILSEDLSERVLGERAVHSVRPERIRIVSGTVPADDVSVEGTVEDIVHLAWPRHAAFTVAHTKHQQGGHE